LVTRDIMQKKLCGTPGVVDGPTGFGTGLIPKDRFHDRPSTQRGIADAFDQIQVKHKSGGISTLNFKSFEQGREKFQGDALDFGWADEEGDDAVYMEFLFRMAATPTNPEGGTLYTTYTPIKGKTILTNRFTEEVSPDRTVVYMGLKDALHITPAEAALLERNCPAHEKEARIYGRPGLGGGAVFAHSQELYTVPTFPVGNIPRHWRKIWGIDFGIDHPFGAALLLWDVDNDIIYVLFSYRMKDLQGALITQHCRQIKEVGVEVPVAWPHDGAQRDPKSGEQMQKLYKQEGIRMLGEHAQWPEGGYSFEAGIFMINEMLGNGKLKICASNVDLLDEMRQYRREDGKIVKLNDDIISAMRYAIMMKRFAQAVPLGSKRTPRNGGERGGLAKGVDFNPF
jgi:phage terminase large subunit-like protein